MWFWCTYLYDTLRPKVIYQANLDSRCELVDILKVEGLGDQLNRWGESLAGLRLILQRILAYIHERLTLCARTYIRDEIANYRPSDEDLDYPARLEQRATKASDTTEHLRRILRGQASLFDWSRSTSFAMTLTPRILESQIDAKKELEKSLKTTCEDFIMSVTKLIVDPMLSFVTKVTAVKAVLSSGAQDKKEDSVLAKPLRSHAFAAPERIVELTQKVSDNLQQELPKVMAKMKLYLQNPTTRMILFKPIKTNIVEAHVQLQSLIRSEYSPEEMQNFGLVSIQQLQSHIDNLL